MRALNSRTRRLTVISYIPLLETDNFSGHGTRQQVFKVATADIESSIENRSLRPQGQVQSHRNKALNPQGSYIREACPRWWCQSARLNHGSRYWFIPKTWFQSPRACNREVYISDAHNWSGCKCDEIRCWATTSSLAWMWPERVKFDITEVLNIYDLILCLVMNNFDALPVVDPLVRTEVNIYLIGLVSSAEKIEIIALKKG